MQQLIQRIEHTSQGRLVAQFSYQCRDRVILRANREADFHALQSSRPIRIDPPLHANLVGGRAVEGYSISC